MRAVIMSVLGVSFAVWYGVQRGRVTRAREYSNAAAERWEQERQRSQAGGSASAGGEPLRNDQAMMP
jgi:hypothetical protein